MDRERIIPVLPKAGYNQFVVSEADDSFATIDGGIIPELDGVHAVNSGLGVFIGNYFVGITESHLYYVHVSLGSYSRDHEF